MRSQPSDFNRSTTDDSDVQTLADSVARFAQREIAPFATQWDEAGEFPRKLYTRAAELGVDIDEVYADRISGIAQLDEIHALDDPARGDVKAGDHSLSESHRAPLRPVPPLCLGGRLGGWGNQLKARDARKALSLRLIQLGADHLAAVFRGIVSYTAGSVNVTQDAPDAAYSIFTPANVTEDGFSYESSSQKVKKSSCAVWWNNPENQYKREQEYFQDPDLVAKYGIDVLELSPLGCTSRGQAIRLAKWALGASLLSSAGLLVQLALSFGQRGTP